MVAFCQSFIKVMMMMMILSAEMRDDWCDLWRVNLKMCSQWILYCSPSSEKLRYSFYSYGWL